MIPVAFFSFRVTFEEFGCNMLVLSKRATFGLGEMENSRLSWHP